MGTIWARIGCEADCMARANIRDSRIFRPTCLVIFRYCIGPLLNCGPKRCNSGNNHFSHSV